MKPQRHFGQNCSFCNLVVIIIYTYSRCPRCRRCSDWSRSCIASLNGGLPAWVIRRRPLVSTWLTSTRVCTSCLILFPSVSACSIGLVSRRPILAAGTQPASLATRSCLGPTISNNENPEQPRIVHDSLYLLSVYNVFRTSGISLQLLSAMHASVDGNMFVET